MATHAQRSNERRWRNRSAEKILINGCNQGSTIECDAYRTQKANDPRKRRCDLTSLYYFHVNRLISFLFLFFFPLLLYCSYFVFGLCDFSIFFCCHVDFRLNFESPCDKYKKNVIFVVFSLCFSSVCVFVRFLHISGPTSFWWWVIFMVFFFF